MKILLLDIETTPNLGYTWGKYEQNVIEFKKEWQLLSFAYKWLDDKEVVCITREGSRTDRQITKALWELFDQADVIIAHNGDEFDIKKSKAKFIEHGLKPTSPFKTIDTKKIAKSAFKFNSNSLNDLANLLQLGSKMKHQGFELWKGCMADNATAWKTMARYNKQDVVLLEKIYKRLRGWSKTTPLRDLAGVHSCPRCDSRDNHKRGLTITANGTYQRFQCKSCGGYSRSNKPTAKLIDVPLKGVA